MNEGDVSLKLAELLRNPDDLDKMASLKTDFFRKKAAVDAQLKLGLGEQLKLTQAGMGSIKDGQRIVNEIKEEMIKIDRLCAEQKDMIRNFPEINEVAKAHRNFTAVEVMKNNIETFNDKLDDLSRLIGEDDADMESQANLLQIHYGITQLRHLREDAMDQAKRSDDDSLEGTLQEHFTRLDEAIEDFDDHVGQACMNLIPLLLSNNTSLVVRLAIVIEEEEKFDLRTKELMQAQKEFKNVASRFQALATGAHELRGYKDKFLEAIKSYAQQQVDVSNDAFIDDPDKLEKSVRWFFNDLNAVKLGMTNLMPKKWRIFRTYVKIYHGLMSDWLRSKSDDKGCAPTHMLAIIHWKDKYYSKMEKLGANVKDLEPPLPGGKDSDLVREYRQLITDKIEQWMNQMNKTDKEDFLARKETSLEKDEHGRFRLKTLSDLWRMLREQLIVAGQSDLTDICEGVTDAMFRALKTRQDMWTNLVNAEITHYSRPGVEHEAIQTLQDWLIALANDQIVSIADAEANFGDLGYLPRFQQDFESVVSADYAEAAETKVETLKEGVTDLGFRCIAVFVKLMFVIDFRTIMTEFFTSAWYGRQSIMGQIITTFEDYLGDYNEGVLHHLLSDLLISELSKNLVIAYLGAVRNKGAKFRQGYQDRLREDISAVFEFFKKFPDSFEDVKTEWSVVNKVTFLVDADKHAIVAEFKPFLQEYWDVKLSWVEALLRTRDDIDWGPLGDGKNIMKQIRAEAANMRVERGVDTIMSEVS